MRVSLFNYIMILDLLIVKHYLIISKTLLLRGQNGNFAKIFQRLLSEKVQRVIHSEKNQNFTQLWGLKTLLDTCKILQSITVLKKTYC